MLFMLVIFINISSKVQGKNYNESVELKLNGIHKVYYPGGQLLREEYYKKGKKDGIWKEYYETGELKEEMEYSNGIPVGIWKEYYESGKLLKEEPFRNGKIQGIWKLYYENGNLWLELGVNNNKVITSSSNSSKEDGGLEKIHGYIDNTGEIKFYQFYDTKGILRKELSYKNKVIGVKNIIIDNENNRIFKFNNKEGKEEIWKFYEIEKQIKKMN